jgi:16S rRNA (cytosine967-C5)-methyltransferase
LNARSLAATAVAAVTGRGVSLDDALPVALARLERPADAGLVRELAYGALRWRFRYEPLLAALLARPLKARDADIHALLLVGLYQLLEMRVPDHAAVGETVGGAAALGKGWARGLVNATLRNFLRDRDALLARADADPAVRHAHPAWLAARFAADWPADWEAMLAANNARAPMTVRVNTRRSSREALREMLARADIQAEPVAVATDALSLAAPVDVAALPGFDAGLVSVQDAAAQLAADVVDAHPGMRVLDACAAPGGKTGHLLERTPELGALVAVDQSETRLTRVRDNLDRLGLDATLVAADASTPSQWWDRRPFDRILLDAPCSATGVIRRHPDIKSLRREADIARLAAEQARLLDSLWPLLAPGGKLIYASCSVLAAENAEQVAAFVARHSDVRAAELPTAWGRTAGPGRQILPGEHGMDGFYYACLEKRD